MPTMIELEGIATRTRLTKVRINVMLTKPFFAPLVMKLEPVAREQRAPLSTDGRKLFFNPRLVESWSNSRLQAGILHEVLHCALGHPWRKGDRDHELFNVAADHVVNLQLRADGEDIGENWLADDRFSGMCVEIVYAKLLQEQPPPPPPQQQSSDESSDSGDDDSGDESSDSDSDDSSQSQPQQGKGDESEAPGKESRPGDVETPQPDEDDEASTSDELCDQLDAEWKQAVMEAAQLAQGDGSGCMSSAVEEARRARIDWRAELRRKLQEISPTDYSWRRPNARYVPQGFYMPCLRDERMGTIVIVRDTSGSITDAELANFNAEIDGILGDVKPARTIVIDCDARVAKVWEIDEGEQMPSEMKKAYGRGGTSFVPPFEWLEREQIEPRVLVYLTDMAGTFPKSAPAFDVVWCATSRDVGPFGETLPLHG